MILYGGLQTKGLQCKTKSLKAENRVGKKDILIAWLAKRKHQEGISGNMFKIQQKEKQC